MSCSSAAARSASGLARGELQLLGELHGVDLHSLDVVVGGVILGLDGQRQRFDGPQMQRGHCLGVPVLLLQTFQVEPVGAVNQVHDRAGEQHGLPAHIAVGDAGQFGHRRAADVVRQPPQVAGSPYLQKPEILVQRENQTGGDAVQKEQRGGGDGQTHGWVGVMHRQPGTVINAMRDCGGHHRGSGVEDGKGRPDSRRSGPAMPQRHQSAEQHGLRPGELQRPEQYEEKCEGKRPRDAGDVNRRPRGKDADS